MPTPNDELHDQFQPLSGFKSRFIAFLRFLLFAVLFYGLVILFSQVSNNIKWTSVVSQAIAGNLVVAASALLATFVLSCFEKKPFTTFGLQPSRWRQGITGGALGLALLTAELLAMRSLTGFRFGDIRLEGVDTLRACLLFALLFCAVSLAEETLWRGYALVSLVLVYRIFSRTALDMKR